MNHNPLHRPHSRILAALLLVLAVLLPAVSSLAEPARDITRECVMTPGSRIKEFKYATDRRYKTYWNSYGGDRAKVTVSVPEGEEASAVWFQWYEHPHAIALLVKDDSGEWTECGHTEGQFLSEYLPLPEGTTQFRVANPASAKSSSPIPLAEIHVYGRGDLPDEVQIWNPPAEKADLMLLAAHPDDEILWFGGILPYYAGVLQKQVQVCMMVPALPRRRLEELDALWTCGVRNYPVFARFQDVFTLSLKKQYAAWNKRLALETITGWIRQFKPDVLMTHDVNGEYGHGAHKLCADAVMQALKLAADRSKFKESQKKYGTWDVPKTYIHLYPESVIDFDWRIPLEAFGGQTAMEVAEKAFACYISQQETDYRVEDSGPCDCSLFGLFRSLVGPDTEHNDLFENLTE